MLGALVAFGSLLKSGLGVFTAVSKEKRTRRMEALKAAFGAARNNKRGVFGWALVFLSFAAVLYDVVMSGGENFEVLIQLVALALGA